MDRLSVKRHIKRGHGNAERPLTRVLWERDSHGPNVAMEEVGNHQPHRKNVDFKRYYDAEYAEQELQKLWLKTWLYACREEDIPNVGDRVPFQVGRLSFIIIRSAEDSFQAFYNSCLHRGTKLCTKQESGDTIRCPYHGWEWNNDGTLNHIPGHWDFTEMTKKNGSLRKVKLERYGGFIYINADPESASLRKALGPIPKHFAEFDLEGRYTHARFRKLVPANWKIAQEAFMESYHVPATHPEAVPFNGESQSQYDIWAGQHGHVGRQVTPSAVVSMNAPKDAAAIDATYVYMQIQKDWHYPDAEIAILDAKKDLRAQAAEWHRVIQKKYYGRSNETTSDAIMIDSILYFVFPQSTLWLSESLPFSYAFTPHESDPCKSYFEVRILLPVPKDKPRPPSAETYEIGLEEPITGNAEKFSFFQGVFDQDMGNMPLIQAGAASADPKRHYSHLGNYQELIIQHWNDVIDQFMAG